jgi:glycosyltransferase involved in cell wall biosynthesis/LmbE family N-acetylglucosaminyl deacetylase
MHIGFVSLDYPSAAGGSGVGNQVRVLGRALVAAGHRVKVIALAAPGLPRFSDDNGIKVYRVDPGRLHWYLGKVPGIGPMLSLVVRELEYGWAAYRQIRVLHRLEPFDLIEGTETGALGVAVALPRVPLVIRLHGERYTFHKYTPDLRLTLELRLSRVLQRAALRHARLLIAPSRAHAREISAELGGGRPPVEVIQNLVELPSCDNRSATPANSPPPLTHELSRPGAHVVLYVGRLERVKGISILLQAARRVLNEMPDAHFVLAGGSHPTLPNRDLERMVRQLSLNGRVHFLGHVPWEQLSAWYQRADLCVLPSYYESFGLAALEPQAFGVPVVATTAGGLPEVVEDEVTGVLVPPGNARVLAEAIVRLLGDRNLRCRLGLAGREHAERRFDVKRHMDVNVALYNMVVEESLDCGDGAEHVFLSPHFDDVALSCGGLIHSLQCRGRRVTVVTVFAGQGDASMDSAYTRHLHAKWGLEDVVEQRSSENSRALGCLHVQCTEEWEFLDAPYRQRTPGQPLYASYAEIQGSLAADDQQTSDALFRRICEWLDGRPATSTFYFPLALGQHVDHQLLFRAGLRLQCCGYRVLFYEEWPYVESYALRREAHGFVSHKIDISLGPKIHAILQYGSQLRGLGGTGRNVARRIKSFARRVGKTRPRERYWSVLPATARRLAEIDPVPALPFYIRGNAPLIRKLRNLRKEFPRREFRDLLPLGEGYCLDLVPGARWHRSVIEEGGYRWIGVDRVLRATTDVSVFADCQQLPFHSGRVAAVVARNAVEHPKAAEQVIAEAARVLQPGGVLCGSVWFPKPVHGSASPGTKPLLELLGTYGFVDIQMSLTSPDPAPTGWHWLQCWGWPLARPLAVAATEVRWVARAVVRLGARWQTGRRGHGAGDEMRRIVEAKREEFADQVAFVARKGARSSKCISDS